MEDRRAAIRIPVGAQCLIRQGGQDGARSWSMGIRDASLGGVFLVNPPVRLRLRSVLHLVLDETQQLGDRPRPYDVPATVVRIAADGVGLQFDRERPNAISRLLLLAATCTAGRRPSVSTEHRV